MNTILRFFDSTAIKWFIIGTYAYFCLIILIEVGRRYLLGDTSPWGEMTARYAFVYLTYVAAAEAIRHGRHIRIDLVPNRVSPRMRLLLECYFDLLTLVLAALVIYYSLILIDIQLTANIVMTAIDLNMSYAQAAIPLGWLLIIVRMAQNWIDRWRMTADGRPENIFEHRVDPYGD